MNNAKRIPLDLFARNCTTAAAAGRLTILAGAGISMLPPARLPSGTDLKRMAVEGLCAPVQFRCWQSTILSAPAFPAMVPEVMFQRLYECFGDRLLQFFDVVGGSKGNQGHALLARMASQLGTPVLTTNFDGLIESFHPQPGAVLHLHGELAHRTQMVVRLHQVGKGLPVALARRAGRHLSGRVLCVLGYSGSDEDIRQLLREYRPAELLWLVRNSSDLALTNLRRFFRGFNVLVAEGSLDRIVAKVAKLLRWRITVSKRSARLTVRPASGGWHHALTTRERYAALAETLLEVRQYRAAARAAMAGARCCPPNERPSRFHVLAAEAFRILADTPHALEQARRAVIVARRHGDTWDQATALNALGLVHLERAKTNPTRARYCFQRAASTLLQERPARWEAPIVGFGARVYNNLGLAEMELGSEKAARSAFGRSIRLKRRIGDLSGQGTTAANLAILNTKYRRHNRARRWRQLALLLINRYDQQFRAAYLHRRLGGLFCTHGRLRPGLDHLNKALCIYREILDDGFGVKLTLATIARFTPKHSRIK